MADEKTITKQIELIADEICTYCCKFPEEYFNKYNDTYSEDYIAEILWIEKYGECPLMRL